jgi:hypothetical protein
MTVLKLLNVEIQKFIFVKIFWFDHYRQKLTQQLHQKYDNVFLNKITYLITHQSKVALERKHLCVSLNVYRTIFNFHFPLFFSSVEIAQVYRHRTPSESSRSRPLMMALCTFLFFIFKFVLKVKTRRINPLFFPYGFFTLDGGIRSSGRPVALTYSVYRTGVCQKNYGTCCL